MKTQPRTLMLAAFVSMFWTLFARAQDVNWPEQAEGRIDAILEIKREAMRLPGMRSVSQEEGFGVLGRRAEVLMDELAGLVSTPAFVAELEKAEATDVHAKIALWAVDRQNRPDEYARFAKWYVNRPSNEEAVDYFSRPYMKPERLANADPFAGPVIPSALVPRPGTWKPNRIDEEDQIEANRRILEYCFFMPPTGREFKDDLYRFYAVSALCKTDNPEKSAITFIRDADFYVDAFDQLPKPLANAEAFLALAQIPHREVFHGLAGIYRFQGGRTALNYGFSEVLIENWPTRRDHEGLTVLHKKWLTLANLAWTEPHEKEFAEWLKTVPIQAPPLPTR